MRRVEYLGHEILAEGKSAIKPRTEAVCSTLAPRTLKELRTFLGLRSYYTTFVEDCEDAGPLHKLVADLT